MTAKKAAGAAAILDPERVREMGGELETAGRELVTRFGPIRVVDKATAQQRVFDRQEIARRLSAIEAFFEPFRSMAHQLHKAICARQAEIEAPYKTLDTQIRGALTAYKDAEDRARRAEEQRLAEERRREEEERLAAEAARLEASGERQLAAAVLNEALAAPAPVVVLPDQTAAVDGLKYRREYRWRYLHNDRARAEQLLPREFLCPDEKKITAYAKHMKGSGRVPGIEFFHEDIPVR